MPARPTSAAFRRNKWVVLNPLLLLAVLIHSAWRGAHLEGDYYATDLRNRVVGSRLQKDGLLPYFFSLGGQGRHAVCRSFSRGNTGANAITAPDRSPAAMAGDGIFLFGE